MTTTVAVNRDDRPMPIETSVALAISDHELFCAGFDRVLWTNSGEIIAIDYTCPEAKFHPWAPRYASPALIDRYTAATKTARN